MDPSAIGWVRLAQPKLPGLGQRIDPLPPARGLVFFLGLILGAAAAGADSRRQRKKQLHRGLGRSAQKGENSVKGRGGRKEPDVKPTAVTVRLRSSAPFNDSEEFGASEKQPRGSGCAQPSGDRQHPMTPSGSARLRYRRGKTWFGIDLASSLPASPSAPSPAAPPSGGAGGSAPRPAAPAVTRPRLGAFTLPQRLTWMSIPPTPPLQFVCKEAR